MKKPWFKKSEMHGDLPFKKDIVVSASERRGGALYKEEPCRMVNTQIKGKKKRCTKNGNSEIKYLG
jgi:hypothetical protein